MIERAVGHVENPDDQPEAVPTNAANLNRPGLLREKETTVEAGRAERHGFEYYRHGTLSLYAALDLKTGRVEGKTTRRHTSADFIGFLTDVVGKTRWAREIHIVLDNLSAHRTPAVQEFLTQNPKVHFQPALLCFQIRYGLAPLRVEYFSTGIMGIFAPQLTVPKLCPKRQGAALDDQDEIAVVRHFLPERKAELINSFR